MNTFIITLPGHAIEVPFCCPYPEPAFRVHAIPAKLPRERNQQLDCVNCGRTIVNLAWEPVRPKGSG